MKINALRETLEVQTVGHVIYLARRDETSGEVRSYPFPMELGGAMRLANALLDAVQKVAPHYGVFLPTDAQLRAVFHGFMNGAGADKFAAEEPTLPEFDLSDATIADSIEAGDYDGEDDES